MAMAMPNPTPSDRLALALCRAIAASLDGYPTCTTPCTECQQQSAAVARELAEILRERHGGSSQVADWLDGVGAHGYQTSDADAAMVKAPPTTPDRPPLWRVIQSCLALIPVDGLLRRRPVAVLIRGVRDWIQCHSGLTMKPSTWRQIYDLLTAEAERAEQGDKH